MLSILKKKKTDSFNLRDLLKDDKALEEFISSLYGRILDKLYGIYNKKEYCSDDNVSSSVRSLLNKYGIKDPHFNFERILFWEVLKPLQEEDHFRWGLKPEYKTPLSKDRIIDNLLKKYFPYLKTNLENELK